MIANWSTDLLHLPVKIMVASLIRAAFLMACFFYAGSAFADGGTCPSGANYLNSTGQLVTLASLGVTNCYYIAADGSDSNDGLSEASGHPWAHSPGMSTCTGNCAALTPVGGQGFILKGGDIWNGSNLGVVWSWGGTAINPIYIGVDPAWFTGGAWSRPIWTCGGATCTGATASFFFNASKPYVMFDNIELTGLAETSSVSPAFFCASGANQIYENLYLHGWSHISLPIIGGKLTTNARGFGCVNSTAWTLRYTVWDGSDTSRDMMVITQGSAPTAYGNYFKYVQTALDGCGDNWHDNLFEFMAPSVSSGGAHQDALYQYGPCTTATPLIYNNVIRHTTWAGSGGAVKLWFSGNNPNTATGYGFNNVVYDNLAGNMIDTGGHFAQNYGTWYIFNNTFACGTDSIPGYCAVGDGGNGQGGVGSHGQMTLYLVNNHWISTAKTSIIGFGGRVGRCAWFICTETNGLYQSVAAAKKRGSTSKSTHAFEPTSSSGSTVGKGTNQNLLCTAVNAIDSNAGAACKNDTSYACTYNSTNHTVNCPARTAVTRPTGAWDVGAYQSSSSRPSSE
jgi:hypothetical protein